VLLIHGINEGPKSWSRPQGEVNNETTPIEQLEIAKPTLSESLEKDGNYDVARFD
jgi:hypothetical protein